MTAIGSLVFCNDCGDLLNGLTGVGGSLTCDACGAVCKDSSSKSVTTKSKPSAFPSALRAKRSDVQDLSNQDEIQTEATIKQTCPNCGRLEMKYSTAQLRGADEGSTVFYSCDCGHKFNTNN